MSQRVVITGLGVVAPNGIGLEEYASALQEGRSGLSHQEAMEEYNFGCTVAGRKPGTP